MFLPPPYPSRHLVTTKLPTNWPHPLILATLSSPVAPLQRAVGCVKNNRAATRSRSRFGGPPGRGGAGAWIAVRASPPSRARTLFDLSFFFFSTLIPSSVAHVLVGYVPCRRKKIQQETRRHGNDSSYRAARQGMDGVAARRRNAQAKMQRYHQGYTNTQDIESKPHNPKKEP